MNKIKKGDEIIVIAGKDRGKRGSVLDITPDGKRARVNGLNVVKRHTRPNPNANQAGGILSKEAPMQLSNLAIYNPVTNKADRVGFKFLADGTKVRYFKSNDEVLTN